MSINPDLSIADSLKSKTFLSSLINIKIIAQNAMENTKKVLGM